MYGRNSKYARLFFKDWGGYHFVPGSVEVSPGLDADGTDEGATFKVLTFRLSTEHVLDSLMHYMPFETAGAQVLDFNAVLLSKQGFKTATELKRTQWYKARLDNLAPDLSLVGMNNFKPDEWGLTTDVGGEEDGTKDLEINFFFNKGKPVEFGVQHSRIGDIQKDDQRLRQAIETYNRETK